MNGDLKDAIESITYPSLHIYWLPKNVGLGNALKFGVEKARFDLIARMDSDDVSRPYRFECQVQEFLRDESLVLLGGVIQEFSDNLPSLLRQVPKDDLDIKKSVFMRNPFNHMTVMFRKSAILNVGGYINMPYYEDYYLWFRLLRSGVKVKNTDNVLVMLVYQME